MNTESSKPVFRNAILAAAQVLVSGAVLFVLYFYLLRALGPVQLGIWSLVLATTSLARLSEMGFAGSVVKFVAQHLARDEPTEAATVVETATLTVAVVVAFLIAPVYLLLQWLLPHLLPHENVSAGLRLLPFAIASFWITSVAGVFLATLDGLKRTDIRSFVNMAGSVFHLALVFLLVPAHGLMGLAYAQLVQVGAILIVTWVLIRGFLPALHRLPRMWKKSRFSAMLGYGINLQFAALVRFLLDPLTKALLSKFAGLDIVSYYEMANRMVLQFRSLLVSANQAVVPFVADFHETSPQRVAAFYATSFRFLLFLALPVFLTVYAFAPAISLIWIGYWEPWFVTFTGILCVAWFFSTMSGPAYFSNLGTGHLRWNTISHAVIGIVNLVAGVSLGALFGGTGVVFAMAGGLVLGSMVVMSSFHRQESLRFASLISRSTVMLAVICGCSAVVARVLLGADLLKLPFWQLVSIATILYAVAVSAAVWSHPMRTNMMKRLLNKESAA